MSDFPEPEYMTDIWVLGSIYLEGKGLDLSSEVKMEAGTPVHAVGLLSEQTW